VSRTLVLLRHGKSDWDAPVPDRQRPLGPRGRRQAGEAGVWLAARGPALDLAVVSPATRARQTWERVASALPAPVPVRWEERAYTFEGAALRDLVRDWDQPSAVLLVGHNPALEELVDQLTGAAVRMRTSALAVVTLQAWADAGDRSGRLVAHGRPPLP